MGRKDRVLEEYLSKEENFADVFNGILFRGRQVLHPEDLTEEKGEYHFRGESGKLARRHRDIIKRAGFGAAFALLGIENQSVEDYGMPVRVMEYDAFSYRKQMEEIERKHRRQKELKGGAEYLCGMKGEDRLTPVITLVLYYGKESWGGAADLAGMVDFPDRWREELRPYFSNYRMNMVSLMDLHETERFRTEFGEVVRILPYQQDKHRLKEFLLAQEEYRHLEEDTYGVIAELLHEKKLLEHKVTTEEGKADMCKAIQDWIAEERLEGREEGREEGKLEGREEGKAEGRTEGEERFAKLSEMLVDSGRTDQLLRAGRERAYREELYRQYGICE